MKRAMKKLCRGTEDGTYAISLLLDSTTLSAPPGYVRSTALNCENKMTTAQRRTLLLWTTRLVRHPQNISKHMHPMLHHASGRCSHICGKTTSMKVPESVVFLPFIEYPESEELRSRLPCAPYCLGTSSLDYTMISWTAIAKGVWKQCKVVVGSSLSCRVCHCCDCLSQTVALIFSHGLLYCVC